MDCSLIIRFICPDILLIYLLLIFFIFHSMIKISPLFNTLSQIGLVSILLFITSYAWSQQPAAKQKALERKLDSLYTQEAFETAIPLFEEYIDRCKLQKDWSACTKAQTRLAVAYSFNDQLPRAIAQIDEAITTANQYLSETDSLLGKALFRKGEFLLEDRQAEAAIEAYQISYPISIEHQAWEDAAYAKIGIAVAYYLTSQYEAMSATLNQAQEIQQKYLPDSEDIPPTLLSLQGASNDILGDFDGALQQTLYALQLHLKKWQSTREDSIILSSYYNNIGAYYHSKGDYKQAINYYRNGISIKELVKDTKKDIASNYNNMAIAHSAAGQLEASLTALDKSQSLLSEESASEELTILYNSIARNYLLIEDPHQAEVFARKALRLSNQPPEYTSLSQRRLAEALLQAGKTDEALQQIEQSITHLASLDGEHLARATSLGVAARCLLLNRSFEKSLAYAQQALSLLYTDIPTAGFYPNPDIEEKIARIEGIRILQQKATTLAVCAANQKDPVKYLTHALATFDLSFSWTDSSRQEYISATSKQILTKETRQAYETAIATAIQLYEHTGQNSYKHKAFALAERNKAIVMQERFQNNRANFFSGIPDSLRQKEVEIKRDLTFYNQKISEAQLSANPNQVQLDFWHAKVLKLNQSLNKLITSLEEQYPRYHQLKYDLPDIDIPALQQQIIGDQSLLIEYFIGDKNIYLFAIDKNNIEIESIPFTQAFPSLISGFVQQLSSPPQNDLQQSFRKFSTQAHDIYQLLLYNLLTRFPDTERLFIIPDRILHYLPFEVLLTTPVDASENHNNYARLAYLFKDYQITYNYSARMLMSIYSQGTTRASKLKCLAVAPDFNGQIASKDGYSYGAITSNTHEVNAIQSFFDSQLLLSQDAQEEVFKSIASEFDIIHLATHGTADRDAPLFSRLIFQPQLQDAPEDNLLHTYELYDMQLNARLVTLSACETGIGKYTYGEEVMSLASGFMHTGCSNILMTLWKAQDNAVAQLMELFYYNLSLGKTVDDALRSAKIDFLAKANTQKHPYYWAASVNVGDGVAFVSPPSDYKVSSILGVVIMISFLFILFWQHKGSRSQ
jgi:CHAT domain-containing protein/tetratricopeptide (TPR) repeat protein